MNITKFSINRPIGISMLVALFFVMGLISFFRIGVELLPALNTPYISVFVRYPGANATSIEQQVIKPMEEALSSLPNVKRMSSSARYESGRVVLEMEFDEDADKAAIEATKKIEAIRYKLPEEVEEPVVIKHDENDEPVMEIAITGSGSLSDIYSKVSGDFADYLQQAGGVSEIEIRGGLDKEIAIEIDKERMSAYMLTMDDIVTALKKENQLIPSGSIYTEHSKSDVRLLGQYTDIREIGEITVANALKESIPITAFANIKHQDARVNRYGRVNGEAAVSVEIYKNSTANVVETAKNIEKRLEKLQKENPDYQIKIISNNATYVKNSLHNTLGTLLEGLCTTGMVLFLFLRGWRSTIAVMVAIPTSLIATFFVMYLAGFTFNMMSLMGMTLCIGILVDDAIVVLENIIRHMQQGEEPALAAERGRNEIGMAAIAITLCDAVTFLPIAFMSGQTGQFFRQFGLTIVFAGIFSLLISFTLTPMLASKLYKGGWQKPEGRLWGKMDALEEGLINIYEKALGWVLRYPKKVLMWISIAFISTISLIPLGLIGAEYMPSTDEGSFQIIIEMPVSSSVEETDKIVRKIEEHLGHFEEIKYYLTRVGGSNAYQGRIKVELIPKEEREKSIWEITSALRKWCSRELPGINIRINETQSSVAGVSGGGGGRGALLIELRGNDNEELSRASELVMEQLKGIEGITGVNTTYIEGLPEIKLRVDRDRMKALGVSMSEVESAVNSAISGRKAGTFSNDPLNEGQDTDINVRFLHGEGFKASDLASLPIRSKGELIFLGDVAEISYGTGPVVIRRTDKQRSIVIGAGISNRPLNEMIEEATREIASLNFPKGISYKFLGQSDRMWDTFQQLGMALLMAMVLIYMLLAILYESVVTPFIRMFSLPFGLIGSILFLLLTGNTLNLYSLIGILVMDGVVAKNGTLLIDYALTLEKRGYSAKKAIIEAGKVRLRPIFMTTITMVIGLLPMALSLSAGAETRVSMAWVIIGGLLTSTIFTLLIIPIIFTMRAK